LFDQPVRSVFAYTDVRNLAEQRALTKCGMRSIGAPPTERYPIPAPQHPCLLFAIEHVEL
jgi:RimJ/RimL family protein N-acetyltransferase